MKKTLLASAVAMVATSTMASDLALQEGQYSFALRTANAGFSQSTDTYSYPGADSEYQYSNSSFNLQGRFEYGYSDSLVLGLYARVYSGSWKSEDYFASEVISSNKTTDFDFAITPSVRYYISDALALKGFVSYSWDDANKSVDQDGNESYSGSDWSVLMVNAGVQYDYEYRPNVLLTPSFSATYEVSSSQDPEDDSDNDQTSYLQLNGGVESHLFLAENFSVDLGVSLTRTSRLGAKTNGEEIDFGDNTYSRFRYGTTFGFTYYIR